MAKKQKTYEYLDVNLLETAMQNKHYQTMLNHISELYSKRDYLPAYQELKLCEEIKDCQKVTLNYFLSQGDKELVEKLIYALIDNSDLYEDVYEKACAKLIEDKTPEEAMEVYKILKNRYFFQPSNTVLKHILANTKKASTCLFFIKDLKESYQKYGVKSYDDYILEFYKRFRVVCTPEEYEHFVDFGFDGENLQKQ